MEQFENWLDEHKRFHGDYPLLTQGTVVEAVNSVSKQKHCKLIEKVIRIYRARDIKEVFVGLIKSLVDARSHLSACRMAIALELFHSFSIDDFIVPLIIQDKLPLAEEFLRANNEMQREIVCFLDQYVNNPMSLRDLAL